MSLLLMNVLTVVPAAIPVPVIVRPTSHAANVAVPVAIAIAEPETTVIVLAALAAVETIPVLFEIVATDVDVTPLRYAFPGIFRHVWSRPEAVTVRLRSPVAPVRKVLVADTAPTSVKL